MLNNEVAEVMKDTSRVYDIAEKTTYKQNLTAEEKETSEVLDAWAKEVGKTGNDSNKEIAAFVTRTIQDELYTAPDELLDSMFTRGNIGEFDDYEAQRNAKNTLIAHEAAKGGNVPRSYLNFETLKPQWHNLQVESDISYVDMRKNGWKSVAEITTFMKEALQNKQFAVVLNAIDAAITGGDQLITVAGAKPTMEAMDALTLYLNEYTDGSQPFTVSLQKYCAQMRRMTGYAEYLSDAIENFAIQLQNLSQKEQTAASHLVNLSKGQKEYLNRVQESLASGENLNAQLYQRELSTSSLSQVQQQSIMVEAGLMTSDGQYNLLSTEQARLNIENSTTFTTLTAEEQHETRAAISQTVAKQAQADATNAATKAQLLFNAAVSVGKQLLLSLAIGAVVFAVEKLIKLIKSSIKTYEDLVNKASEANKAYEETATTLEDLNKQWKDLQKKKDEASKTDGVTDEETAKIERQSKYLEAQIKLYEILAKQKAEEANKAAYDVANAENNVSLNQPEYSIFDDPNGIGIQPKTVKNSEYLDELAEKYDTLSGKLSDLNQAWNDGKISQEEYEKQSENLSDQINNTGNAITDTYQKVSDNYANAQDDGSETYKAIKDDFDHATDSFNNWASTYGDGVGDIAAANEELTDSADDASDTLADTYEKLNSAIDEIQSAYNALSSAVEEYNEHGALSMDAMATKNIVFIIIRMVIHIPT